MKKSTVPLLCSLYLASFLLVESFLVPGRAAMHRSAAYQDRQGPSSTTTLLQAIKRVTFRSSNGYIIQKELASNTAFEIFLDKHDVLYLIDETNHQRFVRPKFQRLVDGANYTFFTVTESLLIPSLGPGGVPESPVRDTEQSFEAKKSKTISIKKSAGITLDVDLSTNEAFKAMLDHYRADYLINEKGRAIFGFDDLADCTLYEIAGSRIDPAAANSVPFPYEDLPSPNKVTLPSIDDFTEFVCEEGWMDNIQSEIERQFPLTDLPNRKSPLALVRCSRGGKTRSIKEVAHRLKASPSLLRNTSAVIISFNGYSSITDVDEDDPLQAILRRLVFELTWDPRHGDKFLAYDEFCDQNYFFNPARIASWLGNHPMILFVDELNNLEALTDTTSDKAFKFGRFIKQHFLARKNRYFIFTSHNIDTVVEFKQYIDRRQGSKRRVTRYTLPYIGRLSAGLKLDPYLKGVMQTMFYGFIPGLIVDQARLGGRSGGEIQEGAVAQYNVAVQGDAEQAFKNLLRSFVTGDITRIPKSLHVLLDPSRIAESAKVCWILFHLEYVARNVALPEGSWVHQAALDVSALCSQFLYANPKSGKGWETAFSLVTLIRCIAGEYAHVFLPDAVHNSSMPEVQFNRYIGKAIQLPTGKSRPRTLDECTEWAHLEEGLDVGDGPTIVVFAPTHSMFSIYDVLVLYVVNKEIKDSRGYQLKEGKGVPTSPLLPYIGRSFLLKGAAPIERAEQNGWEVPSESIIDDYFGESGQIMNPKEWLRLANE